MAKDTFTLDDITELVYIIRIVTNSLKATYFIEKLLD